MTTDGVGWIRVALSSFWDKKTHVGLDQGQSRSGGAGWKYFVAFP